MEGRIPHLVAKIDVLGVFDFRHLRAGAGIHSIAFHHRQGQYASVVRTQQGGGHSGVRQLD